MLSTGSGIRGGHLLKVTQQLRGQPELHNPLQSDFKTLLLCLCSSSAPSKKEERLVSGQEEIRRGQDRAGPLVSNFLEHMVLIKALGGHRFKHSLNLLLNYSNLGNASYLADGLGRGKILEITVRLFKMPLLGKSVESSQRPFPITRQSKRKPRGLKRYPKSYT